MLMYDIRHNNKDLIKENKSRDKYFLNRLTIGYQVEQGIVINLALKYRYKIVDNILYEDNIRIGKYYPKKAMIKYDNGMCQSFGTTK